MKIYASVGKIRACSHNVKAWW